ncbi:MAG: response regulator transcription factor [Deltaproteobacteria bacterium]|nr:response regulator transcription factor [Deltaproteobacteria bacterium]
MRRFFRPRRGWAWARSSSHQRRCNGCPGCCRISAGRHGSLHCIVGNAWPSSPPIRSPSRACSILADSSSTSRSPSSVPLCRIPARHAARPASSGCTSARFADGSRSLESGGARKKPPTVDPPVAGKARWDRLSSASVAPNGKRSILVVEDERAIGESIQFVLRREGFDVELAANLRDARERLAEKDLVIMDLMLPDGSGFDLLREVRASTDTPVIVVTSRDEESDRVAGLESGADDYVTKPFSPREIVARVRAVLRRAGRGQAGETRPSDPGAGAGGALEIRQDERRVSYLGSAIDLTRAEFDLLATLHSGRGRVFSRQQLIEAIWGHGHVVGDRTIDGHVKAVRRKLAEAGAPESLLSTVRGVGYRLEE